jgi:hypothetical protein
VYNHAPPWAWTCRSATSDAKQQQDAYHTTVRLIVYINVVFSYITSHYAAASPWAWTCQSATCNCETAAIP